MSPAKLVAKVSGFRRMSAPDIFRRPSKGDANQLAAIHEEEAVVVRSMSACEIGSSTPTTTLFALPTELQVQILTAASFEDLCSFRLACRQAHRLIFRGEIVRQWINSYIDSKLIRLHPPPKPPSFAYILEQRRRYSVATETATVLAEYVEREILRYTLRRLDVYPTQSRNDVFKAVKAQLRHEMIPLIFTVQHYLEHCAEALLAMVESPGYQLSRDYAPFERKILENYDSGHLLLAHKFWLFLSWLNSQILNRPSYVGGLEKTIRGWVTDPLDRIAFRLFMVFGNFDAMKRLIPLGSYKHRRKFVEMWTLQLDPERNVQWQQNWQDVLPRCGQRPTKKQAVAVLGLKLAAGDIWVDSARAVLMERGLLPLDNDKEIGTPWQTMDFLCEIAGYDVLHTPPSMLHNGPGQDRDFAG